MVGMIAERENGTLLVAIGCDLATVGDDGEVKRFASVPHEPTGFRLNDGRLDDRGRLWVGLMSNDLEAGTGILYRYDPDGSWQVMDDGFTLINGLAGARIAGRSMSPIPAFRPFTPMTMIF